MIKRTHAVVALSRGSRLHRSDKILRNHLIVRFMNNRSSQRQCSSFHLVFTLYFLHLRVLAQLRPGQADHAAGDAARHDHAGTRVVGRAALRSVGAVHARTQDRSRARTSSHSKRSSPAAECRSICRQPLNITKIAARRSGTKI